MPWKRSAATAPCAAAGWRRAVSCAAIHGMKAATTRFPPAIAERGRDGPEAPVPGDCDLGCHSAGLPVADRAASAEAAANAADRQQRNRATGVTCRASAGFARCGGTGRRADGAEERAAGEDR